MIDLFAENSLLLLFVVASVGYLLGTIKIKGSSLGVAAILFTGLAIGAIDQRLQIPETILFLGLSIYVYSLGLSSGPAFFSSYRKNGVRDFLFVVTMLFLSGLTAALLWTLFDISAAATVGIYAGSTTNTAALAGVIDLMNTKFSGAAATGLVEDAAVGYAFSYPMGVLGGMIAIVLLERWLKIDYSAERKKLRKIFPTDEELSTKTILVTNEKINGKTIRDLMRENDWNIIFCRNYKNGKYSLSNWDTVVQSGDSFMVVGNPEELEMVTNFLGKEGDSTLSYDRHLFDTRRIFVSNPKLSGRTISELNLNEKFDAVITRIRRGDMEMLAKSNTVLEIGDRIRFVARREDLKSLSEYFGDSYQAAGKINLFSFGLGIGLGLILGSINFSFGGGVGFKLGYAGGPLIVGLVLGALRRTGPISWTLPYSANVTLQQIGLILLLTAIGVRSGNAFVESISLDGLWYFLGSVVISLVTAFSIIFAGYKILKMPFSLLTGMVANQPAILDFAISRAKNNIPQFGYTLMFPIALILKIVIAQVLFLVLS